MNDAHLELLSGPEWQTYLATELVPWFLVQMDGDDELLEVGPGPGLMTDMLRRHVRRIVAVEVDPVLAAPLAERMQGTNVTVLCEDACATSLPTGELTAATCATMLHHVPSPEAQDEHFREVHRVLRPGGRLIGVDSVDYPELRAFHADDVFVPVDPATLGSRLAARGGRVRRHRGGVVDGEHAHRAEVPVRRDQTRMRPAQLGPAQLGPAPFRPARFRPAQFRPARFRPAQLGPAQFRPAQFRPSRNTATMTRIASTVAQNSPK